VRCGPDLVDVGQREDLAQVADTARVRGSDPDEVDQLLGDQVLQS
jgi:hypothetical protein